MTKEQFRKQKEKEIKKIMRKQLSLIRKVIKISVLPAKRQSTALRRAGKLLAIGLQIRQLEMQKQIIIAQPHPKHLSGASAVCNETGSEQFTKRFNCVLNNHHPNTH